MNNQNNNVSGTLQSPSITQTNTLDFAFGTTDLILIGLTLAILVLGLSILSYVRFLQTKEGLPIIKELIKRTENNEKKIFGLQCSFNKFQLAQARLTKRTNWYFETICSRLKTIEDCKIPMDGIIEGINEIKESLTNGK